ncbi:MAG: hypothetical protein M1520_00965 [Candidatus Marsarchaeota archaeon]|nr:hypothetical protein [Candidatus Marsarchaeota archaeon]
MADAQIVHLYHRRLYNSDIDRLLRDEDKSSKTYRLFALGDESRLLDPSKRRQIIKKGLGLKLLRDISEGWEKAGDYERDVSLKRCFYDHAMNAAEILSVKGEVANERRILIKIKRSGIADISGYKKRRKNHYLDTEASKKLGDSIV